MVKKSGRAEVGDGSRSATAAFALASGPVDLGRLDTVGATTIGPRTKRAARKAMEKLAERLAALQERLYAQGLAGNPERVLLILQGMDTAGKDGVIAHVIGVVNPAGDHLASFKKPTSEELSHGFLWRIEKQVPEPGRLGVFNRSQYEDVLVVRVHDLVPESVWGLRYDAINQFEAGLTGQGVTIVKCFLHVSERVQKKRLIARLEDPEKYWKYNQADVTERGYWDRYQLAYADALRKCNTSVAGWSVVPADRKWYRNWAVAALLTEALERVDPQYPPAGFDVETERLRVAAS